MQLTDDTYLEIDSKLPVKIFDIQHKVVSTSVNSLLMASVHNSFQSQKYPETEIDIAAICLRDAVDVAVDVIYALRKSNENLLWFRKYHPKAPLEIEACRFSKFYIDDAALRLYASAEHIANFIISFFELPKSELKKLKKGNSSVASTVGKYMVKQYSSHQITAAIQKLLDSSSWEQTISYRNYWVHEQPPLIEGSGIVYQRKSRLNKTDNGYSIGLTLGDKPKYSIDELLSMATKATKVFVDLIENLSECWFNHLNSLGLK